MSSFPHPLQTIVPATRGRMSGLNGGVAVGVFRLATDPLFNVTVVLDNIVVGSRYRITRRDNGDEVAAGVASSSTETITGVPVYANPMLVDITVRNASGSPAYRIFDTAALLTREGATAYILQQQDE